MRGVFVFTPKGHRVRASNAQMWTATSATDGVGIERNLKPCFFILDS